MSGHDSGISLRDIILKAVGPKLGEIIDGASQLLPDCYGCTRQAIPLKCKRCGDFACTQHAYVNVGRLEVICRKCIIDLMQEIADIKDVDPHEVLGIDHGSTRPQIDRAFRLKAKTCHPDYHPDNKEKEQEWARLQWAYEAVLEVSEQ